MWNAHSGHYLPARQMRQRLVGASWDATRHASPGTARHITMLEVAYAAHELVFAILFLAIVAIPFRRRARWAWWSCWAVMLANITYTRTFGAHDATIFARSLIGLIGIPVLLLVQAPAFFSRREEPAGVRADDAVASAAK